MAKDRDFKDKISIKGFSSFKIKCEFYNPDKVFIREKELIICESSSTSDRKVHIGELTQFLIYVVEHREFDSVIFVEFLCGKNSNSPKIDKELMRLRNIYNNYPLSFIDRKRIKGIYISDNTKKHKYTIQEICTLKNVIEE